MELLKRLEAIENRLAVLERRSTVKKSRKEKSGGVRGTRTIAYILGIILLLFGWTILEGLGPILGLFLILYAIVVSVFVKPQYIEEPVAPVPPSPTPATPGVVAVKAQQPEPPARSLEADIGKRIFAWVGIIALLIGITFFISYSFQNFGNSGKLLTGYLTAVILFWIGRRVRANLKAYSYVLEGGAWALAYYMTYATSFVSSLNVIDNPTVTYLLLLVMVGAMATVSLLERSPVLTAGAFLLGYSTAAISGDNSTITLWTVLILSIAVLFVSVRMRWYLFSVGGTIATYLAYYAWLLPIITRPGKATSSDFLSGLIFLILYGVLFGFSHLSTKPQSKKEIDEVRTGIVANVGLSFFASLQLFQASNIDLWAVPLVFTVVLGAFYGLARVLPHAAPLQTPYLVLTVSALTAFFPMKFSREAFSYFWMIEAMALTAAGALVGSRTVRVLGYAVSALVTVYIAGRILESRHGNTSVLALSLLTSAAWLASAFVLRFSASRLGNDERSIPNLYVDAAIALLVLVTRMQAQGTAATVFTGIEGLLVLLVGFAIKNAHLRSLGIVVLLFAVFSVFILDFADLDSFGRMVSFIVVGAVLLLAAYLYNKYRATQTSEEAKTPGPPGPTT